MFHKLAILTVMLVALGGALLVLRQQRLEVANQNAALFAAIQQTRQAIWQAQSKTSVLLRPSELQHRIDRAKLGLEPFDPTRNTSPARGWAQAPDPRTGQGAIR